MTSNIKKTQNIAKLKKLINSVGRIDDANFGALMATITVNDKLTLEAVLKKIKDASENIEDDDEDKKKVEVKYDDVVNQIYRDILAACQDQETLEANGRRPFIEMNLSLPDPDSLSFDGKDIAQLKTVHSSLKSVLNNGKLITMISEYHMGRLYKYIQFKTASKVKELVGETVMERTIRIWENDLNVAALTALHFISFFDLISQYPRILLVASKGWTMEDIMRVKPKLEDKFKGASAEKQMVQKPFPGIRLNDSRGSTLPPIQCYGVSAPSGSKNISLDAVKTQLRFENQDKYIQPEFAPFTISTTDADNFLAEDARNYPSLTSAMNASLPPQTFQQHPEMKVENGDDQPVKKTSKGRYGQ